VEVLRSPEITKDAADCCDKESVDIVEEIVKSEVVLCVKSDIV
jgi:hypothetical protein